MSEVDPRPPGIINHAPRRSRNDGWTAKRRRTFLTAVAEGHTVEAACSFVGLTASSAYALRRRADGAAFALGWQAACLLGRDALADTLTSRAIDGQVDTYTRADGAVVTRHRFDNRLACALLTRLDRLATFPAAAPGEPACEPEGAAAARAAAGDFALFLDLVEEGGDADALDRFLRDATYRNPQLPQLKRIRPGREALIAEFGDEVVDEPFWYDEEGDRWLTWLDPPPDFAGWQHGVPADPDYARTLSDEELAERAHLDEIADRLDAEETAEARRAA